MFYKESLWILKQIKNLKLPGKDIIDIGAASDSYRKIKQPHINNLYESLQEMGFKIEKLDIEFYQSNEHTHDITKPIPENLKNKFFLGLANNILEHIESDKLNKAITNISDLLVPRGILVCTAPFNLPYHTSPIDNMLRPTPKELKKLLSEKFEGVLLDQWEDEHYREPFISNPQLAPKPIVTGGVFIKKTI